MSVTLGFAMIMLAAGPVQAVEQVDVAFEQMVAGQDEAAIRQINANEELATDDPARLMNLGVAHARRGDTQAAREAFEAVLVTEDRQYLETAEGEWVDSRVLARQALAMLDEGRLVTNTRMANR